MMEELRLTQSGLANSIGLNQNAVSNWLNGKSTMPENTARAIEQAHRVRWQWLLNGEGAMLLDDMGNLSENEVRLLKVFRQCDAEARADILDQAEFQLGRSMRRADRGK